MRTEIGAADFVRAAVSLGAADAEARGRIAGLLGLERLFVAIQAQATATDPGVPEPSPQPVAPGVAAETEAEPLTESPAPDVASPAEVPLRIERLDPEPLTLSWPAGLPAPPAVVGGRLLPSPPLVSPRLERGVVHLLLSSRRAGTGIDADAVVRSLSRLDIADPLPAPWEWSVHAGADVLVDVSSALSPFEDDVERLLRQAENVGGDAVHVWFFEHCPGRGVFGDDPDQIFQARARRTVVVGAFGARSRRSTAGPLEWAAALDALEPGTELVGVCPFEAGRAGFATRMPMVAWSEATTTGVVVRALRGR